MQYMTIAIYDHANFANYQQIAIYDHAIYDHANFANYQQIVKICNVKALRRTNIC